MTTGSAVDRTRTTPGPVRARPGPIWLVVALGALGLALAVNAVLGPLVLDVIRYRYGTSMTNQAIGLDATALILAAPLALVAAALVRRGHRLGAVVAMAPAAFAAYMAPQYVIGPDYTALPGNNEDAALGHIALFVLAVAVLVGAWRTSRPALSQLDGGADRARAWVVIGLAAFITVGRQLPAVLTVMADPGAAPAYRDNPTAFWLVVFLDLGVITPAALAAGVGLLRGAEWARGMAYAVIGWFLLVPASVAAMALAMWVNDDPLVTIVNVVVFGVAAALLTAAALLLYRPLLHQVPSPE